MAEEIKMVYADVENQLEQMTAANEAMNPTKESPIEGNVLDVVDKLNELSVNLETLLIKYQQLLGENILTTTSSVEFMQETDETISSGIHGSGGHKMLAN